MPKTAAIIICICVTAGGMLAQQSSPDFSGDWKLNPARSEIGKLPSPPETDLKVDQSGASVSIWASAGPGYAPKSLVDPLDGRTETRKSDGASFSTQTKWEGAALLANTLVAGSGSNYTIMERWKRSANGTTLTIRRTVVDSRGESESILVYETRVNAAAAAAPRPALVQQANVPQAPAQGPAGRTEDDFVVTSGTRILLHLRNAVDTKHSVVGDRVYLESSMPVFVNQHMVIPSGSYVLGTITESERAPKGKGRSALNIRFDSITLPNGVTRDFRSRAGSVDTAAELDRDEGRLKGEGNTGHNAKTVGETAAVGAAIGTIAGAARNAPLTGLGVGAAAGGAAGLIGVLISRGPDVILRQGTAVEMVLDRDIRFSADELSRWGR
jgi:hypothetical protein